MDKRKVIEEIQAYLQDETDQITNALKGPLAAPVPVDVRERLEARLEELKRLRVMYQFLPTREYGPEDVIVPSALVELELRGNSAFYLLVPSGGGLVLKVEGRPVQVVTPQSPLGEAMLGHRMGDTIRVGTSAGGPREYRVLRIS